MIGKKPTSVDAYIEQFPETVQNRLNRLRSLLRSVAPDATEELKWGKPVFKSAVILFAYSAHKSHISFIPTGPAMQPFAKELSEFVTRKDSVILPYDQPLPENLITRIAEYRKEDAEVRGAKWKY